nr:DUF1566 domain-containing protein [bacterium]
CCYGAQTDWNAAIDWCYNISFGDYSDWRLPNAKELESISDYGESYPAVEEAWFPNTKKERYWTSTSYSNVHPEFAFAIDVRYSSFDWGNKLTDTFCLRAVRGPDPGSGSGKSSGLRPGSRGADFDGNGTGNPAIFRPASGLWAVRGLTRIYFGGAGDTAVPGNYDGGGGDRAAVFRPASGLWAVRGLTHFYYGTSADQAVPGDLLGQRRDLAGIFRPGNNLWSFRGLTRFYYGTAGDQALPPGQVGGPRLCLIPVTGQTTAYRTGDDGYYEAGAPFGFDLFDIGGTKITVDNNTGLIWAADGNQAGCCFGAETDWAAAVAWCQNLNFAGSSDWRLANARELQTIADYGTTYPSIDTAYFPNTKNDWYWSSTTMKGSTARAFIMQFDVGGYLDDDNKTGKRYVRAVAGP